MTMILNDIHRIAPVAVHGAADVPGASPVPGQQREDAGRRRALEVLNAMFEYYEPQPRLTALGDPAYCT